MIQSIKNRHFQSVDGGSSKQRANQWMAVESSATEPPSTDQESLFCNQLDYNKLIQCKKKHLASQIKFKNHSNQILTPK